MNDPLLFEISLFGGRNIKLKLSLDESRTARLKFNLLLQVKQKMEGPIEDEGIISGLIGNELWANRTFVFADPSLTVFAWSMPSR